MSTVVSFRTVAGACATGVGEGGLLVALLGIYLIPVLMFAWGLLECSLRKEGLFGFGT